MTDQAQRHGYCQVHAHDPVADDGQRRHGRTHDWWQQMIVTSIA
jgi:hypothetical protein